MVLFDCILLCVQEGQQGGEAFEKGGDIMDIWFDSGVSWAAVLKGQLVIVITRSSVDSHTPALYNATVLVMDRLMTLSAQRGAPWRSSSESDARPEGHAFESQPIRDVRLCSWAQYLTTNCPCRIGRGLEPTGQ